MVEILRFIERDERYNRATALISAGKQMFFGLVVKRVKPQSHDSYFCIYCSLSADQYSALQNDPTAESFSFLGITNDCIMVNKQLCDNLLIVQPQHFVGTHFSIDRSSQMVIDELVKELEVFCNLVYTQVKNHEEA
jgi:hypothetical protein